MSRQIPFADLKSQYNAYKSEIDKAVLDVMGSSMYIMGPEVEKLEKNLAAYVGAKHALSVSSGTDALLLALMSYGIKAGDEVITTPFTFIATAEVIALVGAKPVFADIDETTYNLDVEKVKPLINERTKAIIPVSLYGLPADMDKFAELTKGTNIKLIEDACQSFGATDKGKHSCNYNSMGCTSFFPSKPLGCYGDGGAVFTNDDSEAEMLANLRNHGQIARYKHKYIGINGRLDAMQAAVLNVKLAHFKEEIATRIKIGNDYTAKITSLELGTVYQYKLVCGDAEGETLTFTTESYEEIPNLNFDSWTQNGKMWYPNSVADDKYAEGAYWATGNAGVTTLKSANSYPVEDDVISGKAAKLETISIMLAKYAAGNLFIGAFAPNGLNTTKPAENVVFGRPYSGARPTKFKGYYKYKPGTSMSGGSVPSDRTLTIDECDIYIKLWSNNTVIGEAHLIDNRPMDNYEAFELPIEYTDKTKYPDKITIVATSSRYGGEFSGMSVVGQVSAGSTLWVDEFSLSYE